MDGMSLLDVLRGVMLDPAEQAVYDADPGAYLEQYGYQDVDAADLSEAFGLVADTLPVEVARAAWTGESGPEAPTLGDDTADFDDSGEDTPPGGLGDEAVDVVDQDAPVTEDDGDEHDTGDEGDTVLSFGEGEAGEASDAGIGDDFGDEGLFGTAATDGAPDGAGLDDLDAHDDAAFGAFTAGADDGFAGGLDHDVDVDDLDDTDDTGDLAEIDGLGPVVEGPDDLDIGSF
jgi:hypothetical protein